MMERKTEQAKSLLVRYIRDQQMKQGDRLPPQDFLRKTFKFGTATISQAINELKSDGVVEVRDKVGVFVVDPNADGHAGRTIGIALRHTENSLYYSCLLTALEMKLIENGCMIRPFRYQGEADKDGILFHVDDFPGLRRSLENHALQGLIHMDDFNQESLDYIRSANIPLVFVGAPGGIAKNGAFLDYASLMGRVKQRLRVEKPQRPLLICQPSILDSISGSYDNSYAVCTAKTAEDAELLAEKIAAMPDGERYDWLICLDDIIALALSSRLAITLPPEKLPGMVIASNILAQLRYPVRKQIVYGIELDKIAAMGTGLLINAMKENRLDAGKALYSPIHIITMS